MSMGLIGRKCGMTRIFNEDGDSTPVTVIEILPNKVTQLKTQDTDGYRAVQVTTGTRRASRVTKPMASHFAKAKVEAGRGLWEFPLAADEGQDLEMGKELTVEYFANTPKVDVQGTSKGKGFAGVIKRWNFTMQDATHGNSLSHRSQGSTGQRQSPGRVWKNKKMAGQMGNVTRTAQNLEVAKVDVARGLLLVKGAVPGATNGDLVITPAVKQKRPKGGK
jgi:large subunit ribosomal protein L3